MAQALYFLLFTAFLGICYAQSNYIQGSSEPRVHIESVHNMTPNMQLDATETFKRVLSHSSTGDQCSTFRQRFTEKYPEYTWHVVMYRAYSIQYIRSIDLRVGDDHYLLFATKK